MVNFVTTLPTLEFRHPSTENGCKRYVKDGIDLQAPIEDGSQVWFSAGIFEFQLPDKNTDGQQVLKVVAPNTDLELTRALQKADQYLPITPVTCIYREYDIYSDGSAVMRNKAIRLTVSASSISIMTVSLNATWKDLTNRRFCRRIYRPDTHPGGNYL